MGRLVPPDPAATATSTGTAKTPCTRNPAEPGHGQRQWARGAARSLRSSGSTDTGTEYSAQALTHLNASL
eukprot:7917789-Pyramimonas_sp.AAC.1